MGLGRLGARPLNMVTVRLSHTFGDWPLLRQTPAGAGRWSDVQFVLPEEPGADVPDYWLVCDGLERTEESVVAPGRVIFVTAEPEAIHSYRPGFLKQFGLIVTSQASITGRHVIHTQPALPWHIGVSRRNGGAVATKTFDDLKESTVEKRADLSVVCSSKADIPGQRRRLAFVESLKDHFDERLDWYGTGIRPIDDKWDAIAPYRFHLCLENAVERDYWTEKLGDAYLGGAFPLYHGCPNLADYFPTEAFATIDIDDPARSIQTIESRLAAPTPPEQATRLLEARDAVLNRYNLFPMIASLLPHCAKGKPQRVVLQPESEFQIAPSRRLRAFSRIR
jgi:Glycosyltransferase family 10 (fucosyltransferase) C-term